MKNKYFPVVYKDSILIKRSSRKLFARFFFIIIFIFLHFNSVIAQTKLGGDILGGIDNEQFGRAVSLSSDGLTLAVGAPYSGAGGKERGKVNVYNFNQGEWTQLGNELVGQTDSDRIWSGCIYSDWMD